MTTTWKLQGITADRGQCDHCGRTLARLFRVVNPEGAEMVVGRTCSAKLTGYSWSVAQAKQIESQRIVRAAAVDHFGALYTDTLALAYAHAAQHGTQGAFGDIAEGMEKRWLTADGARAMLAQVAA
jgi:hypothetical protein